MCGNYMMIFIILDYNYNMMLICVYNIIFGIMILFCDKYSVDLRKEMFIFMVMKMLGNVIYDFQVDVLENNINIYNLQVIEDFYEFFYVYSIINVSL